jgi:uncharacterized oligopeptide transporter (OPT) family protein
LYEWKVIPFGLANTLAAFMHMMHKTLHRHSQYSVVYLDDIVVYLKSWITHVKYVDAILQSILEVWLYLNKAKYTFGAVETTFVGFRVLQEGIDTENKKVEAITSWAPQQWLENYTHISG